VRFRFISPVDTVNHVDHVHDGLGFDHHEPE
jgi:hypothetical protein